MKQQVSHSKGHIGMTTEQPVVAGSEAAASSAVRPPVQVLHELLMGFWVARAIHVAAQLGVADTLSNGARSAAQIAETIGANPDALYRLLRALAAVGVLAEDEPRTFALTPVGTYLRSDVPESLGALAALWGSEFHQRVYARLLESVRTGLPMFAQTHGMQAYQYLDQHPEEAALMDAAMTGLSEMTNTAVLAAYGFSGIHTLVDIGGGQGALLAAVLVQHPTMRGILFERPQVIGRAHVRLASAGLADRCEVVAGDFFEGVPTGADGHIFKNVLIGLDDTQIGTVLQHCRQAIAPGGRLLIIDRFIHTGGHGWFNQVQDLQTMVNSPSGLGRTADEFHALCESAGFSVRRFIPTGSYVSILEAVPNSTA
jgi:hypothetical protein